jgi:hypothetical protein
MASIDKLLYKCAEISSHLKFGIRWGMWQAHKWVLERYTSVNILLASQYSPYMPTKSTNIPHSFGCFGPILLQQFLTISHVLFRFPSLIICTVALPSYQIVLLASYNLVTQNGFNLKFLSLRGVNQHRFSL